MLMSYLNAQPVVIWFDSIEFRDSGHVTMNRGGTLHLHQIHLSIPFS